LALDRGDWRHARANCGIAEKYGASPAGRNAAAEFGAGQAEFVAKIPKQRHLGITLITSLQPIYDERSHTAALSNSDGEVMLERGTGYLCLRSNTSFAIGKAAKALGQPT